jgi:hypothetical protein
MLYQLQMLYSFEWQWLQKRPLSSRKVASRSCILYSSVSLYYPQTQNQILSQNNPCPRRNSESVISEWTVRKRIKIDFPKIVICNLKWTCTFWMWIWGLIWKPFLNVFFFGKMCLCPVLKVSLCLWTSVRFLCIKNHNQLVVAVNKDFFYSWCQARHILLFIPGRIMY